MKTIFAAALMLTSLFTFANDNFTSELEASEFRVNDLIANSAEWREQMQGRNLASQNEEDRKWAKQWDEIMSDQTDKNWMDLSLKL